MNIFDIKTIDIFFGFDIGDWVSVRNKGKNLYRIVGKLPMDGKFTLQPWARSRPVKRPTILESPLNLKLRQKGEKNGRLF